MWTDERVEDLKRLWTEGLSASEIAKQLGNGLSRNAVIGKVHRLGLAGRERGTQLGDRLKSNPSSDERSRVAIMRKRRQAASARLSKIKAPGSKMTHFSNAEATAEVLEASKAEFEAASDLSNAMPEGDTSKRRSLLALQPNECRWPVGDPKDPGFFFCGADSPDKVYCRFHSFVARQPSSAMKNYRPYRSDS